MSRNVSLLILFGTVIAIGALFFQVISPFVFPLFFAGVLAVLFVRSLSGCGAAVSAAGALLAHWSPSR